jgi:DNA-binding NarL/FixJ family response regulator
MESLPIKTLRMNKLNIIIAEDLPRDREFLLSSLKDYKLSVATNGEEALELIKKNDAKYIVSDLQMPRLSGIELARNVWSFKPEARIVFWSHYQDEIYLRSLSSFIPPETVYGYVLKDSTSDVLLKAVNHVFLEYQCWIDPKVRSVQARSQRSIDCITDAEYIVLVDIALGLTDNIIARRRYLSRRGVQSRLKSLYQKLNIKGIVDHNTNTEVMNPRSRAVAIALQRGLINTEELSREEKALAQWIKTETM